MNFEEYTNANMYELYLKRIVLSRNRRMNFLIKILGVIFLFYTHQSFAQSSITVTEIDSAWASNSINTVVFRKNSLVSFKDEQFISYYNQNGFVVVGKRKLRTKKWMLQQTPFRGNIADAHNCISMMVDGDGFIHLAWNHHNNPLHYAKSKIPGALEFEHAEMTGINEMQLSYPEFYSLADGDLLFLYRDGGSGRGNLVINRYYHKIKEWKQLHGNLIDGEGKRNAYWQACVDINGCIHLSWVWRETPDVATNHDMCYAYSDDGGITWKKSTGEKYQLPIKASTAEYVCYIPPKSELINQTSMYANEKGNVFIATYWRDKKDSVPQYHIIYKINSGWKTINTVFRKTAFSLSGTGTKKIPIARPQIISWKEKNKTLLGLIYRDEERNNVVSLAICDDVEKNKWQLMDLLKEDVGSWEPGFDTELWKQKKQLNLFILTTIQVDGEGKSNTLPQMVKVLEWEP